MESKEEVHSDDGSYELVNFDDYADETEQLNVEAVVSSTMDLSDDSSYDLLCYEVTDILVLTDDEGCYNMTDSEDNPSDDEMRSFSSESANSGMEFKSETDSDPTEGELGFGNAIDSAPIIGDMGIKGETHPDAAEGDVGIKHADDSDHTAAAEEVADMRFDRETNSDSKAQLIPYRVNKGKKRDLMTMLSERSNSDLHDFPTPIKLKHDIKEVAKNHITRYLPAKSLFKCRQVSKEWNRWISSPFFAHVQSHCFRKTSGFFQNSKSRPTCFFSLENSAYGVPYPSLGFLPEVVSIKSSCNGLLLCQSCIVEDEFYICNPANTQWITLPPLNSYDGVNPKMVLAFEPSSLDFEACYQVIRLYSLPYTDMGPIAYFEIYDSKTKSWREPDMICPDLDAADVKGGGIFINGVVYWETTRGELLACDFQKEMYSVQKLPCGEGGALTNIHGELCYVRAEYDHSMRSCILDIYGDGGMSLKNSINISVDDVEDGELVDCTVLGNSCDDVVALVVKVSQGQKRLYVHHVKDNKVQGPGVFNHSKKLFPYVNSLVSIH